MKSFEAMFTLLVVISFSLVVLGAGQPQLDYTLHQYQLANDVWRVWYLRGDLQGFDKASMNKDAEEITQLTGWCVYLEEEDVASCLGEGKLISVQKKAWVNGAVKDLTLVLAQE